MKSIKDRLIEMLVERCWTNYRPVPGKKPYSPDSCELAKGKKKKKKSK